MDVLGVFHWVSFDKHTTVIVKSCSYQMPANVTSPHSKISSDIGRCLVTDLIEAWLCHVIYF